ncbi:MAG: hypothetical protein ABIJ42_01815 [Acidobacteriota bacterium]
MKFLSVSLIFRLAEYMVFVLLHIILGMHYLVAVLISLFSFYFVKFFVYKELVFTCKRDMID